MGHTLLWAEIIIPGLTGSDCSPDIPWFLTIIQTNIPTTYIYPAVLYIL